MTKRRRLRKRWWLGVPLALYCLAGLSPLVLDISFSAPLPDGLSRTYQTAHTPDGPLNIAHIRAGTPGGQRVIFVHGTPGDASGWADYLAGVPYDYDYIALDRPGFGGSHPERPFVSLSTQAAALEPFLTSPDSRPVILVGHSLGGPIVAEAAARYPDQVAGIVVVAGSLDPDLEETKWMQYIPYLPPFNWTLPTSLINTNEEVFALEAELRRLTRKLGRIRAHVEVIHGTEDTLVPYENVAFMEQGLGSARSRHTVTLKGRNHFLPWTSADEIQAAIDRLKARIDAETAPRPAAR